MGNSASTAQHTPGLPTAGVMQLYPPPALPRNLEGLYLNERMPTPRDGAPAMIYANFISSLDGRIAVTDTQGVSRLPAGLTNARDWRLFQELQAHADCLVTHGGYLRALARGRLDNVLQVGVAPGSEDITRWRAKHAETAQPAVAIVSASLDFALPDSLRAHGQAVHVLTTANADAERRAALQRTGADVVVTGPGPWVEARDAVDALAARGWRRLYLQTGPRMLESALREQVLARLYVTLGHQIIGGGQFDTMVRGDRGLGGLGQLRLRSLYLDEGRDNGGGQMFARFDVKGRELTC